MTKTINYIIPHNLVSLTSNELNLTVPQIYDMQNKSIIILKINCKLLYLRV